MHVVVAICTWNRAWLLERTLASIAQLEIPAGVTWEVLVVNNNSTDATEQVLDRLQSRLPLRRMFVGTPGKVHALNAAILTIQGDLILWTDDDVVCPPDWLARYVDASRQYPGVDFFGGPITPIFMGEVPYWVKPAWRTVAGLFAAIELGDEPFLLDMKRLPFGANFAVRPELQKKSQYDPRLGRIGGRLRSGEETAIMQLWLKQGHRGMWVPNARVEHAITPDRLSLEFVRRFFFGLGESKEHWRQGRQSDLTKPIRLLCFWRQALRAERLQRYHRARSRTDQWVKYIGRAAYNWGRVEAAWALLPAHLKPAAVKRLRTEREHPRWVESAKAMPAEMCFAA